MTNICIIAMALLSFWGYKIDKSLFSPRVAFCTLFTIICFMANLQKYGFYSISEYVYLFILGGVICFFIGASTCKIVIGLDKTYNNIRSFPDFFSIKGYKFLLAIAFTLSIVYSAGAIKILLGGGTLFDIYQLHQGNGINDVNNELQHSFIDQVLSVYILTPLQYFITPLSINIFLKTGNKKYLYYGFILALFRVIYHGGRAALVFAVLYFVVMYFVIPRTKENKLLLIRVKRILLFVLVLSIFLFFSMTIGRDSEFGKSVYVYLAGGIPNLAGRFAQLFQYEYTSGLLSFRGFFYPFLSVMKALYGNSPTQETIDEIFYDTQEAIVIGDGIEINAYVTCFFFFYADGGFVGVVLGSLIYGFIGQYIYERMKCESTLLWLTLFSIFFVNVLFYSFNSFMLSYIQVSWSLVYTLLFFIYSKSKREIYGKNNIRRI